MSIQVGDTLPAATFRTMTAEGPAPRTTDEVFKGRKVVLFAVPGAFTPTCHKNHLPGFADPSYEAIKEQGPSIAGGWLRAVERCHSSWDAWAKSPRAGQKRKDECLADGRPSSLNGDTGLEAPMRTGGRARYSASKPMPMDRR